MDIHTIGSKRQGHFSSGLALTTLHATSLYREQMQRLLVEPLFRHCADERLRSKLQGAQAPAWFQHAHRRSALTSVPYFSMAVTNYTPSIIPHLDGVPVALKAVFILSQWSV